MTVNVTVGRRSADPIKIGDSRGIDVSLSSNGYGGSFIVVMEVPAIGFRSERSVELTSMKSADINFILEGELSEPKLCEMVLSVSEDGSIVSSQRALVEVLPHFSFDTTSDNLVGDVCSAVGQSIDNTGSKTSISEDMSQVYGELGFIELVRPSRGRYLNLTDPELVPQYGDGSPDDVAVVYLRQMCSKGYTCCLVRSADGTFVGVSNGSRGTDSLDDYVFIKPSDSCEGVDFSISMDMAKNALRSFQVIARKGRDYGFVNRV